MVSQRVAGVPPVVATGKPEGWEIIFCVYTMISLSSPPLLSLNQADQIQTEVQDSICIDCVDFSNHKQWNHDSGWKNTLNNLRLIVQPL